jgi:predicted ABC-type ATPase
MSTIAGPGTFYNYGDTPLITDTPDNRNILLPAISIKIKLSHLIIIDSDIIKSQLPEYKMNACVDTTKAASQVHAESKDIADTILAQSIDRKYSFLYDSTLASPSEEILQIVRACKRRNYTLLLIGVFIPLEIALERETLRHKKTKRKVPKKSIEYTHQHFPVTFFSLIDDFDIVQMYDNSINGSPPTLIAEKNADKLVIFQEERYNNYRKRGDLS